MRRSVLSNTDAWASLATTLCMAIGCSTSASRMEMPQAGASAASEKRVGVTFSIAVPRRRSQYHGRKPLYVSPNTQSASIEVSSTASTNGNTTSTTVPCTTVCSGTISAPVGADTFIVNLYEGVSGSGSLLSTGTANQIILANQANMVNVTFNPVIGSVSLSLNPQILGSNTAGQTSVLTATAYDPSGAQIIGGNGEQFVDQNGNPTPLTFTSSFSGVSFDTSSFSGPSPSGPITANLTLTSSLTNLEFPIISANVSSASSTSVATTQLGVPGFDTVYDYMGYPAMAATYANLGASAGEDVYASACTHSGFTGIKAPCTFYDTNNQTLLTSPVVQSGPNAGSNGSPLASAIGFDGNLWFYDFSGPAIEYLNVASGQYSYPAGGVLPCTSNEPCVQNIVLGDDGALWFNINDDATGGTAPPEIGRVPTSGTLQTYTQPYYTSTISPGPGNQIWYTIENDSNSMTEIAAMPYTATTSSIVATFASDGDAFQSGYSRNDNMYYVQVDTNGSPLDPIYGFDASGHESLICSSAPTPPGPQPNDAPMSFQTLPDGTLLYFSPYDTNGTADPTVTRIAPGGAPGSDCLTVPVPGISSDQINMFQVASPSSGPDAGNLTVVESAPCTMDCKVEVPGKGVGFYRVRHRGTAIRKESRLNG